jgi:response regulator of citrate/malate metabolism
MTRVLVLEDEASSQEITRCALQRAGITDITLAGDGETGLKMLGRMEPQPDLVICDIFMPEKDGIEIVGALVDHRFKGGLILVSGADAQYLHVAQTMAIHGGLHLLGVLQKPLQEHQLANLLKLLAKQ